MTRFAELDALFRGIAWEIATGEDHIVAAGPCDDLSCLYCGVDYFGAWRRAEPAHDPTCLVLRAREWHLPLVDRPDWYEIVELVGDVFHGRKELVLW